MAENEFLIRVRAGNFKLMATWQRACEVADTNQAEYNRLMDMITRAYQRLYRLCLELEASGFENCLYDEPRCKNGDFTCYVCPSKIPHWRGGERQLTLGAAK